jgi:hypothetical protein
VSVMVERFRTCVREESGDTSSIPDRLQSNNGADSLHEKSGRA